MAPRSPARGSPAAIARGRLRGEEGTGHVHVEDAAEQHGIGVEQRRLGGDPGAADEAAQAGDFADPGGDGVRVGHVEAGQAGRRGGVGAGDPPAGRLRRAGNGGADARRCPGDGEDVRQRDLNPMQVLASTAGRAPS
jgi:hypothetical protein